MDKMDKIILISFITIILVSLLVVYLLLKFKKHKYVYPPYISKCPDYYIYNKHTQYCEDNNNLFYDINHVCYRENFNSLKYSHSGLNQEDKLCEKKQWANNCSLKWDGITNNNEICKIKG